MHNNDESVLECVSNRSSVVAYENVCVCLNVCVYAGMPIARILCTQMYHVQKQLEKCDIRLKYTLVN